MEIIISFNCSTVRGLFNVIYKIAFLYIAHFNMTLESVHLKNSVKYSGTKEAIKTGDGPLKSSSNNTLE